MVCSKDPQSWYVMKILRFQPIIQQHLELFVMWLILYIDYVVWKVCSASSTTELALRKWHTFLCFPYTMDASEGVCLRLDENANAMGVSGNLQ